MFDDDSKPGLKLVIRGFVGSRQAIEHEFLVESMSAAWNIASDIFGVDAKYLECDRYTVDTFWVY